MANTAYDTYKKKAAQFNPYEDVNSITELKGLYNTAKATGGDYMQYHKDAAKYYTNLIDNGYTDLANELTNSDYGQALQIKNRYSPTNPMESYWQGLTTGLIESAQEPKLSETAQKLFDAYYNMDDKLNGDIVTDSAGNVVGGLNIDHYNTGKNQLDYLNNFDVTAQPYYEEIMKQYNLLGGEAAQGALASGAGENGGNIDSFAQANANRQQLAFTTAGIQQALAAANQNQANWQNVYNAMTSHLASMGALNNEKLGYASDIYATDSAERQNALNAAAGVAQQEMINNINKYLADLGYDQEIDVQMLQNEASKYAVDQELAGTKYQTDANERVSQAQLNAEIAAQTQALQNQMIENDISNFMAEAVASLNSGGSAYGSLNDILNTAQKKYPNVDYVTLTDKLTAVNNNYLKMNPVSEPTASEIALSLVDGLKNGMASDIKTWDDVRRFLNENVDQSEVEAQYQMLRNGDYRRVIDEALKNNYFNGK